MCHCHDIGYRYCARSNAVRQLPHTLPLQWEEEIDPTLPQSLPNAEGHFVLCDRDCDGYHQYLRVTPPPGTGRSKWSELCKVTDALYISNICTAQAVVAAKEPCEVKFTHILSVYTGTARHTETLTPPAGSSIVSKQIFIPDAAKYNLIEHFPEICAFIHSALEKKGNNVLVHCRAGVSRSASSVVAYLMWSKRMTYSAAQNLLREARPIIYTGRFSKQLTLWEKLDCQLTLLECIRSEYTKTLSHNNWVRDTSTMASKLDALVFVPRPRKEEKDMQLSQEVAEKSGAAGIVDQGERQRVERVQKVKASLDKGKEAHRIVRKQSVSAVV